MVKPRLNSPKLTRSSSPATPAMAEASETLLQRPNQRLRGSTHCCCSSASNWTGVSGRGGRSRLRHRPRRQPEFGHRRFRRCGLRASERGGWAAPNGQQEHVGATSRGGEARGHGARRPCRRRGHRRVSSKPSASPCSAHHQEAVAPSRSPRRAPQHHSQPRPNSGAAASSIPVSSSHPSSSCCHCWMRESPSSP